MIIGLSGYARSGKDSAAAALVKHGWERVAFADKLRDFLYVLNPVVGITEDSNQFNGIHFYRVQHIIDHYGWDGYKETQWGSEIRGLLQRLGTECGRQLISDTIWIDAALGPLLYPSVMIALPNVVVTDVRFPNEAQAIMDRGGYVVRVERPGVGPANSHPSETALDDWPFDAFIHNDGTLGELEDNMVGFSAAFS